MCCLVFQKMPLALDHEACRIKVCALCMNQHGKKAARPVKQAEEEEIKLLIPGYSSKAKNFPAGICLRCVFLLTDQRAGKQVAFKLPEEYPIFLPPSQGRCECRICWLAKLFGPHLKKWQKEVLQGKPAVKVAMCKVCYREVEEGRLHTCSDSIKTAVDNLSAALPEEVQAKLAHSYLASQVGGTGDRAEPILLPQASGGRAVPVYYGKQVAAASLVPLVHEEAITIGHQNNISTNTMVKIFSDLRAKHGRDFVAPGLEDAAVLHNRTGLSAISNRIKHFAICKQRE